MTGPPRIIPRLIVMCMAALSYIPAASADPGIPLGSYRVHISSLQEIRNRQIVRQQSDFTCESAALATILRFQYRDTVSENDIIRGIRAMGESLAVARKNGFSLLDLKRYVMTRGLRGEGYADMPPSRLMQFNVPAIVPVNLKGYRHFMIVRDVRNGQVFIADPALGDIHMPLAEFEAIWQCRFPVFLDWKLLNLIKDWTAQH